MEPTMIAVVVGYKGVFINTLVGGGWAIENFCRQTFLTSPPSQAAKTF